ncbi:MAG: hypothetical protein V1744_01655 [Candidatus Altiarchaeota archaeon]
MVLFALVAVVLFAGCEVKQQPVKPVACTTEAKVCPDGSTVGRVGPDCEFQRCPPQAMRNLVVSTEKPLYHSNEKMWFNMTVESETGGLAEIWVHGIMARNVERLRIRENYTLEAGLNHIKVRYTMPSCTGCAGIDPGNYTVTAELTMADKTLIGNTTVGVQQ